MMKALKYAGLIECSDSTQFNWSEGHHKLDGFYLKKILIKQNTGNHIAKEYYPQAEMVQDTESIFHDESIELVIVSGPDDADLNLVAEAIEAGKQVRVL
ncbi:MAG: hypothetical protein H7122_05675 [Chitinophagaceae bacterium]|nr:hypothetical protein [Chitinophagaceae bacterium]